MPVERRGWVIAFEIGSTGNGRNPIFNGRRQPSCGGTSRMMREHQVRICERLGVKFPGPTRQKPNPSETVACQLSPAPPDIGLRRLSAAMVESRMGAIAWAMRQRYVSHPRSSNRTCGFPASGSPTGFTVRHTKQSTDRKRHLRGVLSFFASRHSFL